MELLKIEPEKMEIPYIRVGDEYYKKSDYVKSDGAIQKELRKLNRQTIIDDEGRDFLRRIPKYERFCVVPDHFNYAEVISGNFNQYYPFIYKPVKGSFKWTMRLLRHVFKDQNEYGLDYLQLLLTKPTQILPILCLVSYENSTGKTTFLNWLNELFKNNMVIVGNQDLESQFNSIYATKLITAIDESKIDKQTALEKIKSLATAKTINVNTKFITPYPVDYFGKIILVSNYEDNFINAKDEDVRYWVRKLGKPQFTNHDIDKDLKKEIPAFVFYLKNRKLKTEKKSRMWFSAEQIETHELNEIREYSKSWMFKELHEKFEDFFNNFDNNKEYIEATPGDIKHRFFINNHKVEENYIRRVLKQEYKLETESLKKYKAMGDGEYKTGRPYKIYRNIFVNDNNFVTCDNSNQNTDFTDNVPF